MGWLYAAYLAVLGGSAAICLLGAYRSLTIEVGYVDARAGLVALLSTTGLWALVQLLGLLSPSNFLRQLFFLVGLTLGIGTVFAWLYFASAYTGRPYHRWRSLRLAGAALFCGIVSVKLTNPLHGRYYRAELATEPFAHLAVEMGTVHWLVTGLAYALAAVGIWMLVECFHESREATWPLGLLVAATAVPIVPYLIAAARPDLLLTLNYEPVGVAVFAVGTLYLVRGRFLAVGAPGRRRVFEALTDAVVLVDDDGRVVDHNDRAGTLFPTLRADGRPRAGDLDPALDGLDGEVEFEVDGRRFLARRHEVAVGPHTVGAAITVADVTDRRRRERRLSRLRAIAEIRQRLAEAIVEDTDPARIEAIACERLTDVAGIVDARIGVIEDGELSVVTDGDGSPGVGGADGGSGPSGFGRAEGEDGPSGADGSEGEDGPIARAITDDEDRLVTDDGGWTFVTPFRRREGRGGLVVRFELPDPPSEAERVALGEVARTIGHAFDVVSANREAARLRRAVEQSGHAVLVTDADGIIEYVNPAFEELTGHAAEAALGRTPRILKSGRHDAEYYERLWETILSGEIWDAEIVNKRASGERYWAHQIVAPITGEDGSIEGFVAIQNDVTDRRVLIERVEVFHRLLRHNLRNEVNVIAGNAELALEAGEEPSAPLRRILEAAGNLRRLSDRANRIAKSLDRGRGVDHVPVESIEAVIAEFEDGPRPVSTTTSVAESIVVDAVVEPVLAELVANAIEHGDGEVVVEVDAHPDRGEVEIVVADDGPGIPEMELEAVRSDAETPLEHGSGLGLYLVSWLVTGAGGTVDVTVDDGTTVRVTLPGYESHDDAPTGVDGPTQSAI